MLGHENTLTGTVLRLRERKQELADRAQAYDRALRQSQHLATARKRYPAAGAGSVVADSGSVMGAPGGGSSSSIWQSGVGGVAMAQTAVLGDSHGSEGLPLPPSNDDDEEVHEEDSAADGGVGSELDDSYVDGKRSKAYTSQQDDGDEDDEMKDGGVLGLLAQIYGTKGQGPARVI
jgi:autophagy-related protein 9